VITEILLTSINILSALDYRNNVYIVLSRLCRSIKGVQRACLRSRTRPHKRKRARSEMLSDRSERFALLCTQLKKLIRPTDLFLYL